MPDISATMTIAVSGMRIELARKPAMPTSANADGWTPHESGRMCAKNIPVDAPRVAPQTRAGANTPPEPPESVDGSDFYIVLNYSDGGQKLYRQHADRFMQVDGGEWKSISVKKAVELSRILGQMKSDII